MLVSIYIQYPLLKIQPLAVTRRAVFIAVKGVPSPVRDMSALAYADEGFFYSVVEIPMANTVPFCFRSIPADGTM